jgi:unspecific monooxygenase
MLGVLIRRYDFVPDPEYRLQVQERLTTMPKALRLGLRLR